MEKMIAGAVVAAAAAAGAAEVAGFENLPASANPMKVGLGIVRHFAERTPDAFSAKGSAGASMQGAFIPYPISVLWAKSIETARLAGERELERKLASQYTEPFLPGGDKHALGPDPCHVDLSVFGAAMLEAYLSTGDARLLALGEERVKRQWAPPREDDYAKMPESMRGGVHEVEYTKRLANFADGLSGQTRFWTDDMFMIGYLQTRGALAAAAAGRPADQALYLHRAAHEAVRYLDDLQLKGGRAEGLFYHAPGLAPQCWGRGNGWMAAGLTVILGAVPKTAPEYPRILEGYRKMMAALVKWQRPNGYWGQLVDVPESWDESSATAIFTFAFISGVKNGWLDAAVYGPAARRAWCALCGKLDGNFQLADVCVGTDVGKTAEHYLARDKVVGAPHGQAGMLLCVNALLGK